MSARSGQAARAVTTTSPFSKSPYGLSGNVPEHSRRAASRRRILALVNAETHSDDIRRGVRRFSDEQIFSWLAEMETLGFVESEAVSSNNDLDFTGSLALSALAAALRS